MVEVRRCLPELQPIEGWWRGDHDRCAICKVKRGLFVTYYLRWITGDKAHYPQFEDRWFMRAKAYCIDREACRARARKKAERGRLRRQRLIIQEPKVPDAPLGTCRWCGERLTGKNAARRNYCYPDREGRDCRRESLFGVVYSARSAVQRRGDPVCVDCGSDHWDWEADHAVALEDGGTHELSNLVRRCTKCHRKKTARENAERAQRRATPSAQLELR